MKQYKAKRLGSHQGSLLESPIVDPRTGELYAVDIDGQSLHIFDPDTGSVEETYRFDRPVSSVNLTTELNRVLVTLGSEVCLYNLVTQEQTTVVAKVPGMVERLNDCRVFSGRLYGGGVDRSGEAKAVFVVISPDGTVEQLFDGVGISNGFHISGERLSYIDSIHPTRRIRRFYQNEAVWEEGAPLCLTLPEPYTPGITPVVLDGMWADTKGYYWIACNAGGKVLGIDAESGARVAEVEVPTAEVTSCFLDESGGLYITTARERHLAESLEPDENAGGLFFCQLDEFGVPPQYFPLS